MQDLKPQLTLLWRSTGPWILMMGIQVYLLATINSKAAHDSIP
jgi:hypothetical protein